MGRENVEALIDRWMNDSKFRDALRTDPDAAVAATGLQLDPDEQAALASMDWTMSDSELQQRISRSKC